MYYYNGDERSTEFLRIIGLIKAFYGKRFTMKKLLALLLSALLMVNVCCLVAFAEDKSGKWGELDWVLDESGTLTISGTGVMDNFPIHIDHAELYAWRNYENEIKAIVVEEGVTSIGNNAFTELPNVKKITLPEGITSVMGAFVGCTALEEVNIPKSVTKIEYSAFQNCVSLAEITIHDGVTLIQRNAFLGCNSLSEIYISKSVEVIDPEAFDSNFVENVEVDKNNPYYYSDGNCIIEKASKTVVFGCKNSVIPDGVLSIGSCAFKNCEGLTEIVIPDTVTAIYSSAFSGCVNITKIDMPESVEYIGSGAFQKCSKLEKVVIPAGVESIFEATFRWCASLVDVTIPDTVTSIGQAAFGDCSSLKTIEIPDSVEKIDFYAFELCKGLKEIFIPASVTDIKSGAFSGCVGVSSIKVAEDNPVYHSGGNCIIKTENKTVIVGCKASVIPNGVVAIGTHAFRECDSLTKIIIPSSVSRVENGAFLMCRNLSLVVLPKSVATVAMCGFDICNSLETVLYTGTEDEWNSITFGALNSDIREADIKFNYQAPAIIGDVNGDLEINNIDASLVLRYDTGILDFGEDKLLAADFNNDGEVNNVDAVQILKYDAGL